MRIYLGTLVSCFSQLCLIPQAPVVASAVLVSAGHVLQWNAEIVKRWSNEIQEAVQSKVGMVQVGSDRKPLSSSQPGAKSSLDSRCVLWQKPHQNSADHSYGLQCNSQCSLSCFSSI